MDTKYKIAFDTAIIRTGANGLICPSWIDHSTPIITEERKAELTQLLIYFNTHERAGVLASQCVDFNMKVKSCVEELLDTEVYLTSGGLATNRNVQLSSLTEAALRTFLSTPIRLSENEPIPFHTWLTLPTYEVLDLTLATSFATALNRPDLKHQVWAGFPSSLQYVYQPMIVGEDFLRKSGAFGG